MGRLMPARVLVVVISLVAYFFSLGLRVARIGFSPLVVLVLIHVRVIISPTIAKKSV